MALPEQIRKQSEDIQKLYAQMNDPEGEGEESTEAPEGEAPAAEAAPEASDSAEEGADPEAAGEQGGAENGEDFEQKYRSLQGHFNAEVARKDAQMHEQTSRIEQLEQLLANLADAQKEPPEQSPAAPEPMKLISDAEREEYGDSIDVMRKVSTEELAPFIARLDKLEATLGQLSTSLNSNVLPEVQRVAQRQAATATDSFWAKLERLVPTWQEINNDQGFKDWLLEHDPLMGGVRQTFLEQAQQALDAPRVAAFFHAYAPPQTGEKATEAQPNPAASELEKQIAPKRARASGAPTPQEEPTFTTADIKEFYDDVRAGRYRGREEEKARLERDIFAAQQGGRITQSA